MKHLKRKIFNLALVISLVMVGASGKAQDAFVLDTGAHGLFKNFVGIKFFIADYGATSFNQDLQFRYVSTNPSVGYQYTFKHDFNVAGVNGFYNAGLGMEENLGKHLSINFFNASIGYWSHVLNWNVGVGAGYFVSLNQEQTWRMNASMNVSFQSVTYGFGDYYDTTLLGFVVDGVNVGTSIKNVKYVNTIFSVNPGIELLYRRTNWDFFAGVYFNYVFSYYEKVNFYVHSIPISDAIFQRNGDPVARDAINLNKYTIHIGVMREFGL